MQQSQLIDGKYQLVRCLGEGGMGAVYEGKHLGTGRRVAVKLVSPEVLAKGPDIADRFRREAMASGAIESQYIAHVMDTGMDVRTGSPYLVMELLVGEDLQHALKRVRRFTPDIALRICAHACMGLGKAHETGVIHRDVKPANLFLTRRDHEVVVKLLDFGIAKVRVDPLTSVEADKTRSGMMLGSPLYMSPEQARGKKTIDHRSDIFSLGVVLYEMLAGKTPHAKSETIGDLIVRICGEPARPVQEIAPSVNAATAAIVHKALALDPAARFGSTAEMLLAIKALVPGGFALDPGVLPPEVPASGAVSGVRPPSASRPDPTPAPSTGQRFVRGTAPPPMRAPADLAPLAPALAVPLRGPELGASAATIANTPASKAEPSKSDLSAKRGDTGAGTGNRAVITDKSATPARPVTAPKVAPAPKQAPEKEALQKRVYIPALKRAAVLLWGEDGLNDIAHAVDDETRNEFFRASGGDEWVACRYVIEWCLRAFEGPCGRDRNKMAEYVDRAYDFSYGVIRKMVVRMADPSQVLPRLPGFWKVDFNVGEMAVELDPSGKGGILRVTGSPYCDLVHSRAGMAENFRYAFSQTRCKDVTESHALEKVNGKNVLVIRLRWG